MLAAASLALIVALAIAGAPRVVYGMLLGRGWQVPAYRRWAIRTGAVAFWVELVVSGVSGLTTAAWLGAAVLALVVAYFGRVAGKARRLQQACKGLLSPETRDSSLALLRSDLELRRSKGQRSLAHYKSYARTAMVFANAIDAAGLSDEGIRVLVEIDDSPLDPLMRAMRAQNLAAFLVRNGEREEARKALARIPRPVTDPVYEDALAALDTLLVALTGDPSNAEARSRAAVVRATQPTVLASWQAALAHALAAQGSRDEAMEVLRQMQSSQGVPALDRVARHRGAASPLAEALRSETGVPYR
jgi:hypothetical protein